MKTLILRKPKFMRNDEAMAIYIKVAKHISNRMCRPNTTLDEQYHLSLKISECLNKAAEAGGFRNTEDFFKWMDRQNQNTTQQ